MSFDRSRPPQPAPLRTFRFPPVRRAQLDNGAALLTAAHGDLPLVTARVVLDGGAAAERPGEEGLAWLTTTALEGGTGARTGDELAWEIERLGALLETRTTWDAIHVQLTTRNDRLADALALLAEIVRTPSFPAHEVERLRDEQLAEILRRRSEPRGLADDMAAHYIFARGATYARSLLGLEEHVGTFGRAHAATYHARQFVPGGAALVVVGNITEREVAREATRFFGDWSGDRAAGSPATTEPGPERTTIFLIDRPSAVQSELRVGHVGVPRHHEDYYPLLIMNALVGGVFTSRLNLSLREKHGFTYGVRSSFAFRRAAGPFIIETAVASDKTARAIEEAMRELHAVRDHGATDEEVSAARHYLAGTLPLQMQTTQQLAGRIAELFTFELPVDYFEHYRERIGGVTRDDVARVAREQLHLDRLAIIVVGNAAAVEDDLRKLGIGDVVPHESVREDSTAPI
jgi:zinc protease